MNKRRESIFGKNNSLAPDPSPEIPIDRFEIFANGLDHPECVAFDRAGFAWAGGEAGQVYRINAEGMVETVAFLGGFCAGVALTPDDQEVLVCNAAHGIVRITRNGSWSVFAHEAEGSKLIAPNYGLFNSRGTYYVTDSGQWRKRNGRLLRFTEGRGGEVVGEPFGYANGLALSADERHLFMVESDTDRVFRIDLETGEPEVYAESVGRMPDGLALDTEGNLFVSCYASDDVHRISPSGEMTLFAYDRWAILLSRPTNLAFQDGYIYVANLGRTTITRAQVGRAGKPLANQL
jgi:gluconolactonase